MDKTILKEDDCSLPLCNKVALEEEGMFRWVGQWWHKRQRDIDRQCLFPVIRQGQRDPVVGDRAIRLHVRSAPAWRYPEEWAGEPVEEGERPTTHAA
jgi:hypothetical protein